MKKVKGTSKVTFGRGTPLSSTSMVTTPVPPEGPEGVGVQMIKMLQLLQLGTAVGGIVIITGGVGPSVTVVFEELPGKIITEHPLHVGALLGAEVGAVGAVGVAEGRGVGIIVGTGLEGTRVGALVVGVRVVGTSVVGVRVVGLEVKKMESAMQ